MMTTHRWPAVWRHGLWLGVIFISSACVMGVEIAAGRLIARHLGNSLYTWTSVIAVILAGISIGNCVGGWLSDRMQRRESLFHLFFLSSLACMGSLALNHHLAESPWFTTWNWEWHVFLSVLVIFLLPALMLGTISPVVAKGVIDSSTKLGGSIGQTFAAGASGSIAGTLITGFYLIERLGTDGVVVVISLLLAVMGWLFVRRRWWILPWALFLLWLSLQTPERLSDTWIYRLFGMGEKEDYLFYKDGPYELVRVMIRPSDRNPEHTLRVIVLDSQPHGVQDPRAPEYLEYAYQRIYRQVVREALAHHPTVHAFHIGGGSYSFPRWVNTEWPNANQTVVELDPVVLEANQKAMGLSLNAPFQTIIGDARVVLQRQEKKPTYDLIVGDAFHDLAVPFHLLTLEYTRELAARMTPDGVYVINVMDDFDSGRLISAYYLTLKKVFPEVAVFCATETGVTSGRENFIFVSGFTHHDFNQWLPGHDDFSMPGSLITKAQMEELVRETGETILTDNDAPVDQMLQPLYRVSVDDM